MRHLAGCTSGIGSLIFKFLIGLLSIVFKCVYLDTSIIYHYMMVCFDMLLSNMCNVVQ